MNDVIEPLATPAIFCLLHFGQVSFCAVTLIPNRLISIELLRLQSLY